MKHFGLIFNQTGDEEERLFVNSFDLAFIFDAPLLKNVLINIYFMKVEVR